ncbi:MAG: hypothetical protein ACO3PV_00850 [Pseudohongiellaceae bacterium]|jgi:hypothetical protein
MRHPPTPLCLLPLLLTLALLPAACSSPARTEAAPTQAPLRDAVPLPDLGGHWEKNYQLSDDFESRLALYVADIQRRLANPQGRAEGLSVGGGGAGIGGLFGRGVSNVAISGLARFAEEVTRMPRLDIRQEDAGIEVERENDFPLRCLHGARQFVRSSNAFGNDVCGWNGDRLLFSMAMQGGLSLTHQFSLSADGNMLDVTTTVGSDTVAAPLTIRGIYQRYEVAEDPYNCILTLTRNRVCSARRPPE